VTGLYPQGFYEDRRAHTAHAARVVLGLVFPHLSPRRVVDIGCGTGTWLAAALELGAAEAEGIEGQWVDPHKLDDARIAFAAHDLERPFAFDERFDLAISLEVAEHLSPARADGFVADLVAAAPAVLFSAAVPGQGGVNHLNEQWQSYWARKFAGHGYAAYDIVRPAIWVDDAIPAWYRQNVIVYLAAGHASAQGLTRAPIETLDIVHPRFWERANRELAYAEALPESEVLARRARGEG
jgi:SAM-dependent methyltransferase